MNRLTPKQIARRAVFAPDAFYHRPRAPCARKSHTTRTLHLLLLLAVLYQLISSEFISRPLPGAAPSILFMLHQYVGIGSLTVVGLFWLWALVRREETSFLKLVPWLSLRSMIALFHDVVDQVHAMRKGYFSGKSSGALASAVHGLGLLVVTAMAATGSIYFFATGSIAHSALALHRLFANLMWAYILSHASLAALHHLLGSDILRRMFWIRRGITIATEQPPTLVRHGTTS